MTDIITTTTTPTSSALPEARRGSCNLRLKSCARQRWRILAKAIQLQNRRMLLNSDDNGDVNVDKSVNNPEAPLITHNHAQTVMDVMGESQELHSSVRRFGGFDLIKCTALGETIAGDATTSEESPGAFDTLLQNLCGHSRNWYTYHVSLLDQVYTLNVHHIREMASVAELMGFNNTGNICVWPSEEALTAYVLENKEMFAGKSVLELGGGMTCLAGLFIAKYCHPSLVHLTDGNAKSVDNVETIVRMNDLSRRCFLKTSVLKWEAHGGEGQEKSVSRLKYDFIICADCLFFDETRECLVDAIDLHLEPKGGQALVMAPRRGNTFQEFIDGCLRRGSFEIRVILQYSREVWQRLLELKAAKGRDYNEDIHYPILIVLTKGGEKENVDKLL